MTLHCFLYISMITIGLAVLSFVSIGKAWSYLNRNGKTKATMPAWSFLIPIQFFSRSLSFPCFFRSLVLGVHNMMAFFPAA
jgi:hypothetical protein